MNIDELADVAHDLFTTPNGEIPFREHGFEIYPGFFTIHNEQTGQSRKVLYHPESGYVFKNSWDGTEPTDASKRNLGTVNFDGREYSVRLPEYYIIPKDDGRVVMVQEYVLGDNCGCVRYDCQHASAVKSATGCRDAHTGNWKIVGDEIVLFDFEGTPIK